MAFGRLERRELPPPMSEINMTPLIDVMLVLLVIFMVAAPLMSAALRLDLPAAEAAAAGDEMPGTRLALDAAGQLYWNDEKLAASLLGPRLAELAARRPDAEIQLAVDQAVAYGRVAALLDQLQAHKLNRLAFVTAGAASAPR